MTRYEALTRILETGSFTRAAADMGYTQSAVSQMIHALEQELSTQLIIRSKKGIMLTPDGEELLPFIRAVAHAHQELQQKHQEMQGLHQGVIRIGAFASVSCNWLPGLMKSFRTQYPSVRFHLQQGEYTQIGQWVAEGSVDFGFVNPDAVVDLTVIPLQRDEMLAVLPEGHHLADLTVLSLEALSREPYILLEEGDLNEPLECFRRSGLQPDIQYRVFDDYTIMSMVEQGMGISILPRLVLSRFHQAIITRRVSPALERTIALAYKNKSVLPVASRYFMDHVIREMRKLPENHRGSGREK